MHGINITEVSVSHGRVRGRFVGDLLNISIILWNPASTLMFRMQFTCFSSSIIKRYQGVLRSRDYENAKKLRL